ncbi:MAG TPA: ATP-dependent DNA ligase [Baekduia sp.]|uniref:ATP-dependent DNA ligase n=1 Tax=Baekduia sp. TaxID=2600305 RepID=UPI002D77AD61|nr:ATP-dependent DNA ligase [Baekduia sp.]HET6509589.1 ATP-dependent DNA ligase [Baekduia sp.]
MLFADLATTSLAVGATRSRKRKAELLGEALRRLDAGEVEPGVAYLSGEPRQRRTGVGWAALRDLPEPAADASLTVGEVDVALERLSEISGAGSQAARRAALTDLFARATEPEQALLRGLLSGEIRQGALAGVMADAVAVATGLPRAAVDRATMLRGDARVVAEAALREGAAGLERFHLQVGRPLKPMLASPAASLAEAMEKAGEAVVDHKLDGARIQVHRDGERVVVASRSLDDLTDRLPAVVAAVRALPVERVVLDGEAIALRPDGRPEPFQVTSSRIASGAPGVVPVFFDILHLDGEDLLDAPLRRRDEALRAAVPDAALRVPRVVTADADVAQRHFDEALAAGQEGVVVKAIDSVYAAGRRGASWLKVKPRHTLDLVVLAAEWGNGRRKGWLSNLHLGARAPDGKGYVMLGKTFKGLTDELLAWQTERLQELAVSTEKGYIVHVKPELVVEIAFDGVQTSPRYPGGVALRFARVLRYRPDKTAAEADDLAAVLALRV